MLHPPSSNEQKVEITSPFGKWRVSVSNFRSLSEPFRRLFAPVSCIKLPRGICQRAVDIIRAYTRHPNTTTFNFEGIKTKAQINDDSRSATSILSVFSRPEEEIELGDIVKVITDVYEFSSRWELKKPMHECAKYAHDHLTAEEIIQIIETLSTESFNYQDNNYRGVYSDKNSQSQKSTSQASQKSYVSKFDANYVGYHYDGIIDTSGFDLIVAQHLEKYIQYFYRLPFYKINQIFHLVKQNQAEIKSGKKRSHRKNPNDLKSFALSTDDLILDFIQSLEDVSQATKEVMIGQFVDLNECSLQKLNELHNPENGQNCDIAGYTLEKLIEAKSEIVKVQSELNETKELLKVADENSNAYLTSLQQLIDNQHGFAEATYLNAVRENKVTCDEEKQNSLFDITVQNKIPQSLFEKAKSLETINPQESLQYYKQLVDTYDDKSDELVSERVLEWARSRDTTFLLPVLKMFIKTNRPKILLTCYEVSLIDFKVVPSPTGEKCLKRAVRLGSEEANHMYCEYLFLHNPRKCLKFCQDRSKEDPELEFNAGSILLLGSKGPSSEPKLNSAGLKRRDIEIDEDNMPPLTSPIKIPDTPYLATPKSPNRRTPRGLNASLNFTNDDENDDSDGEVYNMYKDVMQSKIHEDEEEMYKDKFVDADPERALSYFEQAARSGFNAANLVLAVISPSERRRLEYYDHFMVNSSLPQPEVAEEDNFEESTASTNTRDRIFPRTRFVVRACLGLFDMIAERYPNLEEEMIELVNTLVLQDQDPTATEFLMQRSTSGAILNAFLRSKPQLNEQQQELVNKLKEQALTQLPAVQPTLHQIEDHEFEENGEIADIIRIPEYVKTVGERSFYKCPNIKCIEFDYEVKRESSKQSRNDYSLESVGNYAFYGCTSLQAIFFKKIKDTTKANQKVKQISLGDSTFSNCANLIYAELPENLVKIEDRLFFGCEKLISIDIPRRTQEIGASAFEGCKSLEYLGLHDGIKFLREGCFQFCDKLKIIIIPKSIKSIAPRSFRFCFNTTSIFIAEGVQTIEKEAFHGCKSLAFVAFPRRSLKLITKKAFTQCPELKKVTLSRDTIVEDGAFDEGCEILYYDETCDDEEFEDEIEDEQPKTRNILIDEISPKPITKSKNEESLSKSSKSRNEDKASKSSKARNEDKASKSSKAQSIQNDKASKSSKAQNDDNASKSSKAQSIQNDNASKSSKVQNDDNASKSSRHTTKTEDNDNASKSSRVKTEDNASRSSKARNDDNASKSSKVRNDDNASKSSKAKNDDNASKSSRHSHKVEHNDAASKSSKSMKDETKGLTVKTQCEPPNSGLVHSLASEITVFSSGQLNGRNPSSIIEENPARHWYTESDGNAWVLLEFQSSLIKPTHYAIWSHGGQSTLRNWSFQGSNDRQNWTDLSVHENDETIRDPFSKGEWTIETNQTFKYFRLMQTGENWAGNKWLYLLKLDIWGVAYEKKE